MNLRAIRLASGLVLFTYVLLHLTDHALTNASIEASDAMLHGMRLVWQNPVGAAVLYSALLAHLLLAFWALYERRHFRWRVSEAAQLVLGFMIPVLLANHILATRISRSLYGTEKGYLIELHAFWVGNIPFGIVQHVVLVVAWAHGCLGVYFWLRLRPWFARAAPFLLVLAVLLPVLALLGSFQGGRRVAELAQDPAWRAEVLIAANVGTRAQNAALAWTRGAIWIGFAAALAAVFAARGVRRLRERRRGLVHLRYPQGRTVSVPRGMSVLEASKLHRVPHANVCGGRGRCSTCRVRVLDHRTPLPEPSAAEFALLQRVGAGPGVRLACQLRPEGDLSVVPLLPAGSGAPPRAMRGGEERYLVMMFVDLRGSTQLAEHRLPFDTVFLVNAFLAAVGRAVSAAGGSANQMLGDGLLAVFGLTEGRDAAARSALAAAEGIARNVAALNADLAANLPLPLRYGVGIAGGEVIAGDIGYEDHTVFTVLGDAVNVAARLQDLSKDLGCDLLVTDDVYQAGGGAAKGWPTRAVTARGRAAPITVRSAHLGDLLGHASAPDAVPVPA